MAIFHNLLAWAVHHPLRVPKTFGTYRLARRYDVQTRELNTFQLLTFQQSPRTDLHILFFHGGAYVCDASPMHWQLMTYLADTFSCKVTYVDYPLAPDYTAEQTKEFVRLAYLDIAGRYPADRLCLFGDSAGGGLALALRQLIRDEKISTVPYKTVCCSPWLDVSMTSSDYSQQARTDKLLTMPALVEAGQMYAGNGSTRDPFVSPIYASMHDLGDIFVCVSMNELLYPDVRLLYENTRAAQGTNLVMFEQPDAIHDYVLNVRSPASQATFQAIEAFLGFN